MTTQKRRELAALQDEQLRRRAEQSLRTFVEWGWTILEPGTPFIPNWHIDLICESLEAITYGQIHRLVINVPPRYMKSLLVSVLWPVWEWLRYPSFRWLFVSYSESLSTKHSIDRRRVILSDWYQRHWGHQIHLAKDQQAKGEFHNTRRGVMFATSVGGSVTGKGGNRIVLDDPHNPMQAESDLQRAHAIDFFRNTLSTRLDDPRNDAVVLVMQRLHMADLRALCLEQGYDQLMLPALAPTRTVIEFPRSKHTIIREADEPLWPERQSRLELETQQELLGSYGFAGQYQQQPVPRSGGRFKREWWSWYVDPPTVFDRIVQSWDLGFKDGNDNDYVVGLVAGCRGTYIYLLDRFKAKVSFVETCHAITHMVAKYPRTQEVLIEDAANGPAVVDALRQEVHGLIAVAPQDGKSARASAAEPQIEAGQIFLPRYRLDDGHIRSEYRWVEDFVENCAIFPKGEHDDDVDALTQLLLRCRKRSGLSGGKIIRFMAEEHHPLDPEERDAHHEVGYRGF